MLSYEIVIDGELTAELAAGLTECDLPLQQRTDGRVTVISAPAREPGILARVLEVLASLGFGLTALRKVDDHADADVCLRANAR